MKIADCFNEHKLDLFKGKLDNLIFGILFGIFGGLLILSNPYLTNLWLALLLVNVLRFRIDYFNHGIAGTIMFLCFFWAMGNFNWNYFLFFFVPFAFFGVIMDVVIPSCKKPNKVIKNILETRFFYFLVAFIFSAYYNQWIVFFSMAIFQLSYNITKHHVERNPRYKSA